MSCRDTKEQLDQKLHQSHHEPRRASKANGERTVFSTSNAEITRYSHAKK